jgi:hypothetical protein
VAEYKADIYFPVPKGAISEQANIESPPGERTSIGRRTMNAASEANGRNAGLTVTTTTTKCINLCSLPT